MNPLSDARHYPRVPVYPRVYLVVPAANPRGASDDYQQLTPLGIDGTVFEITIMSDHSSHHTSLLSPLSLSPPELGQFATNNDEPSKSV